jgi:hypothetical protein
MFNSITGLYFLSVWHALSVINKAFVLLFCGVFIYSLSLSVHVLFVLNSLKKAGRAQSEKKYLGILRKRLWNLRQLHLATLYLLGFCVVVQVPGVFDIAEILTDIPPRAITHTLTFLFYLDATIFLAFLLIHGLQWFVSARVASRQDTD